jgi:hypothetical protein
VAEVAHASYAAPQLRYLPDALEVPEMVTLVLTVVFAALGVERGDDETRDSEYEEIGEHRAAAAPAFTSPAAQQ